jgi:hypothetical protein
MWKDFWSEFATTSALIPCDTAEKLLDVFDKSATSVMNKHAPIKRKQFILRENHFSLSPTLLKLKKKMRKAESQWRQSRLHVHRDIFKSARNHYISKLRKEKENFFRTEFDAKNTSARRLWQMLAQRTGSVLKCSKKKTNEFKPTTQPEDQNKASLFAQTFTDKVDIIIKKLNPFIDKNLPTNDPDILVDKILITLNSTSPKEVRNVLRKMSSCKNSPDDVISTALLKQDETFPTLVADICNASFSEGVYPNNLKCALINPVAKKANGDPNDMSNFRPISNIKVMGKLIESIAEIRLIQHVEEVSYLHSNQSAYRKKYSTETATFQVFSDWCQLLDSGHVVCIASLDVSAAFDSVNHAILLYRLQQAGILGGAHSWFQSYVSNRTAKVKVENARSEVLKQDYGVPQGSILGPCLFNIYMASLAHELEKLKSQSANFNFHIYADDVLLYVGCKPDEMINTTVFLSVILSKVDDWMKRNSLLLNTSKTTLFLLRSSRCNIPTNLPTLSCGGECLKFQTTGTLRWLGVEFDSHLNMDSFISKTCRNCFSVLRMLRRTRPCLNRHTATMLCNSLVRSRLEYCNSLLNNVNQVEVTKMKAVLHLAARIIMRSQRTDHVSPLLNQLRWLPVDKQIIFKIAVLTKKALSLLTPDFLTTSLHIHHPKRSLRSSASNSILLELGTATKKCGRSSWYVAAPRVWNALPVEIRDHRLSLQSFYNTLFTHYLSSCCN